MLKKFLFSLFFLTLLVSPWQNISAQGGEEINIYFFWSQGCPHCAKEEPFLEKLKQKYPEVRIRDYEISGSSENQKLLAAFGKKLNANVSGVPFTAVGDKYFVGWLSEDYTGKQIEDVVRRALQKTCQDVGKEILSLKNNSDEGHDENLSCEDEKSPILQKIKIPFFGEIETKNFSLPLLTIIIGALDGFNPCAMWTLLFLISLLLGMENRRRMWLLGMAFIIASASVYFIFMAAWLNLILFIGLIAGVRIIIGLIALLGGGYNLKEYFSNKDATCKVTGTEKRQKVFEKLKNITHQKSFYLALGGIILLAFAVNLVELVCSAGLPAVYTQVLALSNLAKWQYYSYILLYIFVFMLDDLFIFFVAMTTLRITGVTTKYSRWSHLIGGILMLIVGFLLIFKPAWLMF
jgi:thiol-disulfide isomerase/thioredoxin